MNTIHIEFMKQLKYYIATFVLVFITIPALQSCLNDSDSDNFNNAINNSSLAIGTLRIIDGNEYYFDLDDGDKMYPGDTSYIHNYSLNDGQRVFVYFIPLKESMPGYKYNVKVIKIENILTKDIITLTEENADSIGNDRINANELWIKGGFLTIEYQLLHSNNPNKKHMLNMVVNETAGAPSPEDEYVNLEFRHNAYDDEEREPAWGVVSFRLDSIAKQMKGKKGLRIFVKAIYDEKPPYIVEFE